MRVLDLLIVILVLASVVISSLSLYELKKSPAVRYVVTQKVVKVTPEPLPSVLPVVSPVLKRATSSGTVR